MEKTWALLVLINNTANGPVVVKNEKVKKKKRSECLFAEHKFGQFVR